MSNVMSFIFNTLRTRSVDPGNKRFFLPLVMVDAKGDNTHGKLLPIEQASWSLGPIQGDAGATITSSFVDNWATYLEKVDKVDLSNQLPIGDPKSPAPILAMGDGTTKVIVDGLQNVFVHPNPIFVPSAGGYGTKLVLEFDYWDGSSGRPTLPPLTLSGPYILTQALCLADRGGGVCNGNASTDLVGDGLVALAVTGAFIDADVEISVKTDNGVRELVVTVNHLLFRGADAATQPSIAITDLTIGASVSPFLIDIWKTAARNAIESPDGRAGIVKNLNATLNTPSNLESLSARMTGQLASGLNSALGAPDHTIPPPSGTSANPVDRFLFDRLRAALNNPASSLFLPQVLCQSHDPSLSPLTIAEAPLGNSGAVENAKLIDLTFTGLTNVKVPPSDLTLEQGTILFDGLVGGWSPPPKIACPAGVPAPPASGTSQFSLSLKTSPPLTGNLALTMRNAQLTGSVRPSGTSDADLTIKIEALKLAVADLVSSLAVVVSIESMFKKFINDAVNTHDTLQRIVDGLNARLANDLGPLGAKVTTYARKAIDEALR